jgi:hypothetical protein
VALYVSYNAAVFNTVRAKLVSAFQTLLNVDASRITVTYVSATARRLLQTGGTVDVSVSYPTSAGAGQAASLVTVNGVAYALQVSGAPAATLGGVGVDTTPEITTPVVVPATTPPGIVPTPTPTPAPGGGSGVNVGVIAGAAAAGVVALGVGIGLMVYFIRKSPATTVQASFTDPAAVKIYLTNRPWRP